MSTELLPPPKPIVLNGYYNGASDGEAAGNGPPPHAVNPVDSASPSESLLDALQLNLAKTSLYWLEAQRVEKALSRGEEPELKQMAAAFLAMKETFEPLADAIAETMK